MSRACAPGRLGRDRRPRRRQRRHPLGLPVHPLGLLGIRRGEHAGPRRRDPARSRAREPAVGAVERAPPAAPAPGDAANPVLGDAAAVAAGERIYRARCAACHRTGGRASPNLFRTGLPAGRFLDAVAQGREGTNMPAFGELLSQAEIWQVHAFLMSRDAL